MEIALAVIFLFAIVIGVIALLCLGVVLVLLYFIRKAVSFFGDSSFDDLEVTERQGPMGPGGAERRTGMGKGTRGHGPSSFW